jgi:hypothetical protein
MRSFIAGASLVVLLFAFGCNYAPHRRDLPPGGGLVTDNATPTAKNLVEYLNENAKRIDNNQAVTCQNVPIDVIADGQKFGISSQMCCQTPRNFRLSGKVLGNPAVDIGSNDKEFWYWISRNQPPYLCHCSYEAMANGAKIPFPFQPDMVVNALGLAQYDPAKDYRMNIMDDKKGHKAIELTEQTVSAQGQRIQKVTVFNAQRATLPQPQVIAHILKDERGTVICVAEIRKVQQVGAKGLIIPKEIAFRWPEQKLQMTMRLENPQVVTMTAQKAADLFTRQNLHYQSLDLATGRLDGEGVQQAGATGRIYRR